MFKLYYFSFFFFLLYFCNMFFLTFALSIPFITSKSVNVVRYVTMLVLCGDYHNSNLIQLILSRCSNRCPCGAPSMSYWLSSQNSAMQRSIPIYVNLYIIKKINPNLQIMLLIHSRVNMTIL